MFSETICKIVGFISLVFIGIYFIRYVMNYHLMTIGTESSIEGFSSKALSRANAEVKKNVDDKMSKLQLHKKTRIHYEDMLKDLDTIVGGSVLTKIIESADVLYAKPDDPATLEFMAKINTMTAFQASMKNTLHNWLDSHGNSAKSYM